MQHHDERYVDAIDRALDGEASGGVIESGMQRAIDRLRILAATSSTNFDWRPDMEASRTLTARVAREDVFAPQRASLSSASRRSLAASLSIILAIVILASLIISSDDDGGESKTGIAAVSSPSALSMDCVDDVRNEPFPPSFVPGSVITAARYRRAAWTASQSMNIDLVKQSQLPQGTQVDQQTYNDVLRAVTERMACRNAGLSPWNDYVMMDPANTWPNVPIISSTPTLPGTLAWFGKSEVPGILRMDDLGDGNIGVMFASDFFDYRVGQYDVYRQIGSNWVLVDSSFYAADETVDNLGVAEVPTTGQFVMWNIYLSPNVVYMQSDQPSTLTVINNASESYIFRIPELDVWVYLESGHSETVTIDAGPGTYPVEMVQPGTTTPKSTRQLRLTPQEPAATPVS
jgi:hypothetical protein